MARESTSGLGVNTRYGPLNVPDGARGTFHSQDGLSTLVQDFSAANLNSDSINAPVTVFPPGVLPLRAWLVVDTAVSLSGTTAAITVGTQGSLGTNGAEFTGTAIGVGFKVGSLEGTWSTGLTATTTVVFGVTNGSLNEGSGRIFIEYLTGKRTS